MADPITHALKMKKKLENKKKKAKRKKAIQEEKAIGMKRREKALTNKYLIDSENFNFANETKGMTPYQKRKVKTELAKIKNKAERDNLNKDKEKEDNLTDSQKERDTLGRKALADINKYESDPSLVNNLKAYTSKVRLRNLQKKDRKESRKEKVSLNPLLLGGGLTLTLTALFMVNVLAWGGISSVMLSHPEIIKELYEMGVLGDALTLGNVRDDVVVDGKVIVKGIGDAAVQGNFLYNGINSIDGNSNFVSDGDKEETTDTGSNIDYASADMAKVVWNFFKDKGMSDEAVAGILGNMSAESSVCPTTLQGRYGVGCLTEEPTSSDMQNYGPAGGIVQWENINNPSSRFLDLINFAESFGKSKWLLETQLNFIVYELTNGYESNNMVSYVSSYGVSGSTGLESFGKISDVEDATTIFLRAYERASAEHLDTRIAAAKSYYAQFKK